MIFFDDNIVRSGLFFAVSESIMDCYTDILFRHVMAVDDVFSFCIEAMSHVRS